MSAITDSIYINKSNFCKAAVCRRGSWSADSQEEIFPQRNIFDYLHIQRKNFISDFRQDMKNNTEDNCRVGYKTVGTPDL